MKLLNVYIDSSCKSISNELVYILGQLLKNYHVDAVFTFEKTDDCLFISDEPDADIMVYLPNFKQLNNLAFDKQFTSDGYLKTSTGAIDYLATSFYLLSCAQELDDSKRDKFGRFPFEESYQKYFGLAHQNKVQQCFDSIVCSTPKLQQYKKPLRRSKIFLSHDVDFINGAILQDGYYALKSMKISSMFQIIFSNLLVKPQWLNMDKIMQIENEYEFKSTFYWLVNKGLSKEGIKNSDYDYTSNKVQAQVKLVKEKGWENGLHKSISDESFESEIEKLKFLPIGNRYHFLKFRPHSDFEKIQNTGLKLDTSLGFAEDIGFRNNYGLPYLPYDFKNKKVFDFIECPLHVMDTTLNHYQKKSAKEAYQMITSFIEKNLEDAVISLLWHNNYFTPYKFGDYFKLYKQLLAYFYDHKFTGITQQEIIDQYS